MAGPSVVFRPRASSVLQYGATLASQEAQKAVFEHADQEQALGSGVYESTFRRPYAIDPSTGRYPDQTVYDPQPYERPKTQEVHDSWMNVGARFKRPVDNSGLDQAAKDASDLWANSVLAGEGAANAEMEYVQQQKKLADSEAALRRAMLAGDMEEVRALLADIEANRRALQQSYAKYLGTVNPQFEAGIAAAAPAGAAAQGAIGDAAQASAAGLGEVSAEATAETSEFNALIGNSAAGAAAAQDMASVGLAEFEDLVSGRHQTAMALAKAQQAAASKGLIGEQALMQNSIFNREREAMAGFDKMADDAADQLEDLEMQGKLLDIQQQQADLAHARALEQISGQIPDMNAISYGRMNADLYIQNRAAALGVKPERLQQLSAMWVAAFEQGVASPAEFTKWFTSADADGNAVRADQGWVTPMTAQERAMLSQAFDAYGRGRDDWLNGAVQTSSSSKGGGGGGEAPNNMAVGGKARNPSSGAYYKRQKYASQMMQYAIKTFGVRSSGQWRDTSVKATGARSSNSDHYSGGAIDLSGPKANMQAAANYFKNHPAVSFVLFNCPGHHDHVHVSFKIGYFN